MVITSQLTSSQSNVLVVNFFVTLANDALISPTTGVTLKIFLLWIHHKKWIKNPKHQKTLLKIIGDDVLEIYVTLQP
jgi:hypothetical protein